MLAYYKYKVDHNQMKLSEVPDSYQRQLREMGYTDEPTTETTQG